MPTPQFPHYTTPFVGRLTEMAEIADRLVDPDCRFLTLVGPGGIGKTRLAVQVASNNTGHFADGIYFVPFQPLNSSEFMVSAIAIALGFQFYPGGDPKQQLLNYFREKTLLLVLDNLEHLLDGADLLSEILSSAPDVRILATSRERLSLLEEWVFDVRELNYPTNEAETDIESFDAVQLFLQHSRRMQANFALTSLQKPALIRICRLVGGMPLGIELAAASVRALSLDELAGEIEHGLDILETSTRNIEPRHRTMRATLDPMWNGLSNELQIVFKKLSVFRGGFSREAAQYIADASLHMLSTLIDRSLVRTDQNGRYDLHELLRQYAEERLHDLDGELKAVRDKHCSYYMEFLAQKEKYLEGRQQKEALLDIQREIDNVREAWDWAVNHHRVQEIEAVLHSLWYFFDIEARSQEGIQVFGKAAAALKADEALWAKLTARQGALYYQQASIERSEALLRESITVLRRVNARGDLAFALSRVWFVSGKNGYVKGTIFLKESLALYTELDHKWGMGQALWLLVYSHIEQGIEQENRETLEQAHQYGQTCLAIYRELDSPYGLAVAYLSLGNATYWLQDYAQALVYYRRSLDYFQDIGIHWGIPFTLRGLGVSSCALGEYADARQAALQGLRYIIDHQQMGTGLYAIADLCVVAEIWIGEGQIERAYDLLAVLDQRCQDYGFTRNRIYCHVLFRLDETLPLHLAAAVARGRKRDFNTVLQEIMHELSQSESDISVLPVSQRLSNPLTERELEILHLIADGLSNQEIADKLILSLGTVKWYTGQIYSKLGVQNRPQAIVHAQQLNLLP